MKSNINRIGMGFLIAFFVISGGLLAYDVFFVWPIKDCEEHGHWWDEQDHICAVPVPLSVITGRHIGAAPMPVKPQVVARPPAKAAVQSPTKR
jgi:hypothetical protein